MRLQNQPYKQNLLCLMLMCISIGIILDLHKEGLMGYYSSLNHIDIWNRILFTSLTERTPKYRAIVEWLKKII